MFMRKLLSTFLLTALLFIGSVDFVADATPIGGNSVTVTSVTPGTTASKLGKGEDAAHASGDAGVAAMVVQSTSLGALAGTTGDYAMLQVNGLGALYTQLAPNTAGGLSLFRSIDLDESEEEVKGSAGQLYVLDIYNNDASAEMFIKVYDGTAAGIAVGTDTPTLTIPCAASTHCKFESPLGFAFTTGITVAATTAIADADTGAPDANDVVVNIGYK